MTPMVRRADGRRIFTDEFKREQIDRVWRGELSLSELSRKLGISRTLLHRWKRVMPSAAAPGGRAQRHVTPTSGLRAEQYIRELQQLLGKQTVEIALLRAELDATRTRQRSARTNNR
jgi:transposase-like protein